MTADGAFVPTNSNKLSLELEKDENTKEIAMTRIVCGFHGENSCKNTGWERNISDTGTGNLWKTSTSIDWTKKPKRERKYSYLSSFTYFYFQYFFFNENDKIVHCSIYYCFANFICVR